MIAVASVGYRRMNNPQGFFHNCEKVVDKRLPDDEVRNVPNTPD